MVIQTIPFLVLMLLVGIASADSVRIEGGLIEGTIEDGLTVCRGIPFAAPAGATVERLYHREQLAKRAVVVVTIGYRLGTLVFGEAKPQAMHFAHTAHAGPVVSEEGLKGLDACLEWRRTAAADISSRGLTAQETDRAKRQRKQRQQKPRSVEERHATHIGSSS